MGQSLSFRYIYPTFCFLFYNTGYISSRRAAQADSHSWILKMNKLILAFSPGASPTTMPLGIASLFAYIRRHCPAWDIAVHDLSVGMRQAFFDSNPEADLTVPFFKGALGTFFHEDAYRAYQRQLLPYYQAWRVMEHALKTALTEDSATPEVTAYEDRLFSLLPIAGDEILALSAAFPEQVFHSVAVAKLVKRRHPKVTVLLGGAALSAMDVDELMVAVPEIDYAFRGEGEAGIVAFLSRTDVREIRGFTYRDNDRVVHNPTPLGIPMHDLPAPDFGALPMDLYLNPEPVVPVYFSRGCTWRKCRFCSHNFSFAGHRTHDYAAFVESLAVLRHTQDFRHFYFADQLIEAADLKGISDEILRQKLDVRFHVLGRPTAEYTREILETAAEAGCRWIGWGVESLASRLLDTCNKGTEPKAIQRVLQDANDANISNLAMMIFGLPGSSDLAFQETLDAAYEIQNAVDAFTCSSFQLFENTPFYRRAADFGLIPEAREILFEVAGHPVHSYRRAYAVRSEDGARLLPRASLETAKWKQWQLFVRGGSTFFETLPAEHYLLIATHRKDSRSTHHTPTRPAAPGSLRRAG